MSLVFLPSVQTQGRRRERRSLARNKRRCPPKPARAHGDVESLEFSLGMTITGAIPQPLPVGRSSQAAEDTQVVSQQAASAHIPFPSLSWLWERKPNSFPAAAFAPILPKHYFLLSLPRLRHQPQPPHVE